MQIQNSMLCFVENTPAMPRAISTWPRLDPYLSHGAISTDNGHIEGIWIEKMNFKFHLHQRLYPEEKIFCKKKYTRRNSKHIYLSVPDFMKPEEKKKKRELSRHQGSYFLFLCFLPPSVSGRILRVWIINFLSAFDLYGLSLL